MISEASALEARLRALQEQLDGEKRRARENARLASLHYTARVKAEREARDATRSGVATAIRWIQEMPPTRVDEGGLRIGEAIVQKVAAVLCRHLESRLRASEETTAPALPRPPPSSRRPRR